MTEAAFVQSLQARPDDDTTRLVFADWLDEQGDDLSRLKAEYVRLDCRMAASPHRARHRRLNRRRRELAEQLPASWLAVVSKAPIELCSFRFECPMKWEKLQPVSGASEVRYCGQCEKTVTYFEKIEDARRHAARGGCVAIDARVVRHKGDLYPLELYHTVGILD